MIVSQVHVNNLNADGTITPGYNISVRDLQSGVTFPVFVPDDNYNADNARSLILYQLQHIRNVHSLSE
jgi:hypothetical protein